MILPIAKLRQSSSCSWSGLNVIFSVSQPPTNPPDRESLSKTFGENTRHTHNSLFTTQLMFTTLAHNICSQFLLTTFIQTIVHKSCSQNLFTSLVQNFCSQVLFTTHVHNFVHNSCLQLLFTTYVHNLDSQLLFTPLDQNFYLQLFHNCCS